MKKSADNNYKINAYWVLSIVFTTIVLLGNVLALKITNLFGFITPAGMICFPITYALGDIITDIYGYKACRRVILMSLAMLCVFSLLLTIGRYLPNRCYGNVCAEYNDLFSMSFRLFLGTVAGYLSGELLNSRIMSVLKYALAGRVFIYRAIMSTAIGISIDSVIFNLVAFGGVVAWADFPAFVAQQIFLKFAFCVVLSIFSKAIIAYIRKRENVDIYDNYRWIDKYLGKGQVDA